tara:strand:+ start:387 stop:581 length:195 start_codon:yes stop_codon:yes gene_type:complete
VFIKFSFEMNFRVACTPGFDLNRSSVDFVDVGWIGQNTTRPEEDAEAIVLSDFENTTLLMLIQP